jgi:hypothetical protein
MPDDESRLKGAKIFEEAIIPETKQTHLPVFEFSYFDPKAEKYVTLKSEALPIKVEGEAPAAPPPVATNAPPAATSFSEPAKPAAPTPPPVNDIQGIRYDAGGSLSFRPLYAERGFLLAQLVPVALLSGLVIARFWRPNLHAREVAALRRERAELVSRLRRENDRRAFYDAAVRVLQLDGAIATGRPAATIDAAVIRRLSPGNGSAAAVLNEVFDVQGEALYAGSGEGSGTLSSAERERICAALAELEKSKLVS